MEPKEKFPKEMADWFKSAYPEFDSKLGVPQLPGQSVPTDDPDLLCGRRRSTRSLRINSPMILTRLMTGEA
jgi:hypothetical protein